MTMNNRIGETKLMNCGDTATIIEYVGTNDVTIQFKNSGEIIKCRYKGFKNGATKSRLSKTLYNIGYIGIGQYTTTQNNGHSPQYHKWVEMFKRCYDEKYQEKKPTYKDCTVCDEWHNFQVFAKWYDDNYYNVENEIMCLDKDILIKGNKMYSPNTCIFVPERINLLFTKNDASRGHLPIGVSYDNTKTKFRSRINLYDENNKLKTKSLGTYKTPEKAFDQYKIEKEKFIKQKAKEYKDKIPERLYNAMMNYEVEITD